MSFFYEDKEHDYIEISQENERFLVFMGKAWCSCTMWLPKDQAIGLYFYLQETLGFESEETDE